jgi:thermitase
MNKNKLAVIAILAVAGLASCGNRQQEEYELLHVHPTVESANIMATNFNIELKDYTRYGIATYSTKSKDQYDSLLKTLGFAPNNENQLDPEFEVAEIVTNDEYFKDQYALTFTGISDAWSITEGSPDVTIAVIDTGIDIYHPELISSIASTGYNSYFGQEGLEYVLDDRGHGTQVTGVIAADKNNNIGIAGAAPEVTILPIKANTILIDSTGKATPTSSFRDSSIIDGILYAIEQGADIINISVANTSYNPLVQQAINQAEAAGVLVVAASGNTGKQQYVYPASLDYSLSVGSVSNDMTKSFFTTFNDKLDVMAPGHNIVTTTRGGHYTVISGTSFSSPYVAAMAAMLKSVYPEMTPADIRTKLRETAIDAGTPGYDINYGYGIANIYQALSSDMATVSFNTMGGTTIPTMKVIPGSSIELPNSPLKEHHTFAGWYKDTGYTVPFTSGMVVESSMILYAKWTANIYTINYYNEVLVGSESVKYGNLLINAPALTKAGSEFIGWYTYGGVKYDFSKTPTSDLELYARWSTKSYSIIYMNHDGSVYEEFTYEYGSDLISHEHPAGPSKDYYDFADWKGTVPLTMPANNIVITPEYTKRIGMVYVTITITTVYEDGSEEVVVIEVPEDQVDKIIAQYGGSATIND